MAIYPIRILLKVCKVALLFEDQYLVANPLLFLQGGRPLGCIGQHPPHNVVAEDFTSEFVSI